MAVRGSRARVAAMAVGLVLLVLGGALAAAAGSRSAPAASAGPWRGTWGAAPLPPTLVEAPRNPLSASFSNQTLRQVIRVSAGGSQVRIRISNEFGTRPLEIGAARLAAAGPDGAVGPGGGHVLTFGGRPTATVPAGAPLISDPVDMTVAPLSSLAVSLYLPGETGPCTCHQIGLQTGFVSGPGDFTAAARLPAAATFLYRAFLTGVEVRGPAPGGVVVTLGDSLTDGTVSTPNANSRWPDRLAERLNAAGGGWSVVNAGISGNRLLMDGLGQSALGRFDRDVLAVPGASHLVVMLGTNDLGIGYGPPSPGRPKPVRPLTARDLEDGYRQLIDRARAHGLKVYGATLTPFEGAAYWTPEAEAVRQEVNAWIRASGAFDGVIDFDAVWRDPARPSRIREGFHAPDNLHGTDAGYRALGDAVDLGLFR